MSEPSTEYERIVVLGRWHCEYTGLTWDGDISNHHGLPPGVACPGPHLRQNADYAPPGMERVGTIGRTFDHRWFWCSSDDFDHWDGPVIDPATVSPVYRRDVHIDRSGAEES